MKWLWLLLVSFNVTPASAPWLSVTESGDSKPKWLKGFEILTVGVKENIVTCLSPTHFAPCSLGDFFFRET